MKTYICLLFINPILINDSTIASLKKKWEEIISDLIEANQLKEINIFRQPGAVITGTEAEYRYGLTEDHRTLTGFLKLCCDDIEMAIKICKSWPTLTVGGTVEIRELYENKNFD